MTAHQMPEALIIEQSLASSSAHYTFTHDFILRENILSPELRSIAAFRYQLYDRISRLVYTCDEDLTRCEISDITSVSHGGWKIQGSIKGAVGISNVSYRDRECLLLREDQTTPTPFGTAQSVNCRILTALRELQPFRLDHDDRRFLHFHHAEYAPFEFEILHYLEQENAVCTIIFNTSIKTGMFEREIIDRILNLAQAG